jgi:hypothetical protein
MRHASLFAFLLLVAIALPACTSGVVGYGTAAMPVAAAPPCQVPSGQSFVVLPAGSPCVAAAPSAGQVTAQVVGVQPAAAGQQLVAVQYRVGAQEWTRAGLQVPGNVVICAGNFLRCALDALFPIPQPTAVPVMAPVAAPAPAAAPCAPAAGPPVSLPCPEPVAYGPPLYCVATTCAT